MEPEATEDKPLPDVAVALRVLRALRDWNQSDMAERAGIDVRTQQRYEAEEIPVLPEALESLLRAAGLSDTLFEYLLLPMVRVLRAAIEAEDRRSVYSDSDSEEEEETLEEVSRRIAQKVAATVQVTVLEHFRILEEKDREEEENAWRPRAEDREAVPGHLERLGSYDGETREFLLADLETLPTWAIAERLAHSTEDKEGRDIEIEAFGDALERAQLAVHAARHVAGPAEWKSRIQGYALAFLSRELRRSGDEAAAQGAATEAERLWAEGLDEEGVLSERKFRAALAEGSPRSH